LADVRYDQLLSRCYTAATPIAEGFQL